MGQPEGIVRWMADDRIGMGPLEMGRMEGDDHGLHGDVPLC